MATFTLCMVCWLGRPTPVIHERHMPAARLSKYLLYEKYLEGKHPWPGPFPMDLNGDGVLSDYEETGYGRIDTAPRR